ncbi:MAG: beta-galactosidase [Pseudomonadota bacterium]
MKRTLGVCYYPEHWPEDRWPLDAAQMVAAGLSWVRIGEFAWSRLEPAPGDFRFDWLDRAIDVLGTAGLKVILGTPTATPPRWMLERHPDMLAWDREGRPRGFGSRRHYCFSHLGYRADAVRITRILAERYGANPHVAAWQTDNEYGCHDTSVSYSPAARSGFQIWLAARYGTVEALNAAWGNIFWSMEYGSFDEVDLPNLTVTEPNPAHVLDFRRYTSDQVVAFNRAQVEEIRAQSAAPIIHNYMGRETGFDHFDVGADLDVASWDSYPLGFLEDRSDMDDEWKRRFARQGDPDFQAFHHDLYRAVGRGRWWVMEQQPGPVNWAPYNPAPLPGMIRLWSHEAFAHGAESVVYFRWRQAPFAQEQMHAGLLRPDAEPAPALGEARQVADELSKLDGVETGPSAVGLVFDYISAWAWQAQPQGAAFDYFRLVFETYRGLRRLGLSVDILPPDTDDLSDHRLVLIPGLFAWPDALRSAVERFEGVCLAGPRTGSRTENFRIPDPLPPQMPGVPCIVERTETLRPDMPEPLVESGHLTVWRDCLSGAAPVIERTRDGLLARMGTARRQFLAGWPDEEAMGRILRDCAQEAGLETLDLQDGLRVRDCGAMRVVFNYSTDPCDISDLSGTSGDMLDPADVRWLHRG